MDRGNENAPSGWRPGEAQKSSATNRPAQSIAPAGAVREIPISDIRRDPEIQQRAGGMPTDVHPICLLLPDMTAEDFASVKDDIAQHGLRHPILLHDGKILDGRHRARACDELGIAGRFEQWSGADPLAFVLSENLHRRHLTPGQKAMVAARAIDIHKEAAHARMTSGKTLASADATPPATGKAAGIAAVAAGVSQASVERALKVTRDGTAEDVRAVASG